MKNGKILVEKQMGLLKLVSDLEFGEVIDERVIEKLKTMQVSGIAPLQYVESNGKRSVISSISEMPSFSMFIRRPLSKTETLKLMHGITNAFAIGQQGIPVSYIVKDLEYIFVNPENLEITCILNPVKQSAIEISEISGFFRTALSHIKFREEDRDNYVARILNAINADNFSVNGVNIVLDTIMEEISINSASMQDTRVNKVDVMRNRAQSNNFQPNPQGMPQMQGGPMPQQPQMRPQGMPQMQGGAMSQQPQMRPQGMPQMQGGAMPQQPQMRPQGMPQMQAGPMPQQPQMRPQGMPQMQGGPMPQQPQMRPQGMPQMQGGPMPQQPQMRPQPAPQMQQPKPAPMPQPVPQMQQPKPAPMPQPAPQMQQPKPALMPQPAPQMQQPKPAPMPQPAPQMQQPKPAPMPQPAPQMQQEKPASTSKLTQAPVSQPAPQMQQPKHAPAPAPQPAPQSVSQQQRPHLVRKKNNEEIYITKPEFKIGKSHVNADYSIDNNAAISRVHCIIIQRNGVNYIKDNDSTNGTYVDGKKLSQGEEVLLKNNAEVKLGDEEFVFLLRKGE